MVEDGQDDEVAASLARLRMFLAPHKPSSSSTDHHHQHSDGLTVSNECRDATQADAVANDRCDSNEDLSSDLSTLAEQFSCAADVEDLNQADKACDRPDTLAPQPAPCDVHSTSADECDVSQSPVSASAAVATVSPISPLNKEYTRVKYLLQCSLPGFRVHDDMVMWDMRNPVLATQYEAHTSGLLELDSWVAVDKLSAAMGDSRVSECGSTTSDKMFATGSVAGDMGDSKKGRKQLVLCKIAVGRSLAIDGDRNASATPLPPGYHSYYLHKSGDGCENGPDGSERESHYRHEYILNDALQILPQYLVRFSYSSVEAKAQHPCALCEKHAASLVCKACDAELCPDCDKEVHSANKLVERHKRAPLREQGVASKSRRRTSEETNLGTSTAAVTSDHITDAEVNAVVSKQVEDSMNDFQATCSFHEGKKIDFYCPICVTPVCVNCKMVGDHSIGDKGAHRLLPIADAYEQSLRESFKRDPLVESRRVVIENKLSLISQWEKDIERNREQVEDAIKQQYEQALAKLDDEVKKKTSVLKGESLEFVRQRQQIEWLDDCLDERRSACSVVEFLSTWTQHKLLRAEQRDFPISPHTSVVGDQVKADLQLLGHLQVVSGEHGLRRLSFSGSDFGDTSLQDDRCGPLSPRSSIGGVVSPPSSVRRPSDNDIRRKLLSMRSVEKRSQENPALTTSPSKALAGMSTLSPEGRKMMEEIRSDLFARRTVRSSSGSLSPSLGSPIATSSSSPSRMFSIQPVRGLYANSTVAAGSPTLKPTTAAWTALLRQELTASKESGVAPPETTE